MKNTLKIILLLLISVNSHAQTIITDRYDPRFIAYMDSIKIYKNQIAVIKFVRTHLDTCSREQYKYWADSLDDGKSSKGRFLVSKRDFKINYFFFSIIDRNWIYADIPKYPRNQYIYQPFVKKPVVITKPRKIKQSLPSKAEVRDSLKSKKLVIEWYMNNRLDSTKLYTIKTH